MYDYFELGVCRACNVHPDHLTKESREMIKQAYDFAQLPNDAKALGSKIIAGGTNLYHSAKNYIQPILERMKTRFSTTPQPPPPPPPSSVPLAPPLESTDNLNGPKFNFQLPTQVPVSPDKLNLLSRTTEDVHKNMQGGIHTGFENAINNLPGYTGENLVTSPYTSGGLLGAQGLKWALKEGLTKKTLGSAIPVVGTAIDAGQGMEMGEHVANGYGITDPLQRAYHRIGYGLAGAGSGLFGTVPGVGFGLTSGLFNNFMRSAEGGMRKNQFDGDATDILGKNWFNALKNWKTGDPRDMQAWYDTINSPNSNIRTLLDNNPNSPISLMAKRHAAQFGY